jgi:hypothetical protein
MNREKAIFSQLMDFVPYYDFCKCVKRYGGDYKIKTFSCWEQFLCMNFAQLTYRESLRDIQECLRSVQPKLYHLGIRGNISRNTLANANQVRDWRIYADFAQVLIQTARKLYAGEDFGVELDQAVYALDATIIDLCLSVFPWARFRKRKGAVKLHTLLDLHGNIPSLIVVTSGKVHEVNILDDLFIEIGAIYIMDRGYLDFARLHKIQAAPAFFIIPAKSNFQCKRIHSLSIPEKQTSGVRCDQIIALKGFYPSKDYPERLRRISYYDNVTGNHLVFLTNNFKLSAQTIADLYRCRWQVELFFKWIKQHLRIKAFYGTSENAVKTQIWIAISIYALVAIVKKQLNVQASLYTILQILSITLLEKMPILQVLTNTSPSTEEGENYNQLNLFN